MTKEQVYTAQLKKLGYYQEAFEPLIRELAQAERQRTRAQKAWSATAPPGGKPSFLNPHFAIIKQLDNQILAYREALGLTPKALRRVRGADAPEVASGDSPDGIAKRLDAILARAEEYDAPVFDFDTSEAWANPPQAAEDGPSQSAAPTAPPSGGSQGGGGSG